MVLSEALDCQQQRCFPHQISIEHIRVFHVKGDHQRMRFRKWEIENIDSSFEVVRWLVANEVRYKNGVKTISNAGLLQKLFKVIELGKGCIEGPIASNHLWEKQLHFQQFGIRLPKKLEVYIVCCRRRASQQFLELKGREIKRLTFCLIFYLIIQEEGSCWPKQRDSFVKD